MELKVDTLLSKLKIKKYNYDVNKVIGIKNNQRYILLANKKLIRIYRGKLKSTPLLCSYVPIESAIFYNFSIEKNVIEKIDLDSFIETKVYEEAGLSETEEYIIKYKVIDKLNDEKKVMIHCVIVPVSFIQKNYKYILKETDYIDYLSFPAFAYKSLYNENILKKANDLFIVVLYDKIFLTFYSDGKLLSIITITGGLNKIYENLQSLKIANFDIDLFKKLLTKKGLDISKYSSGEMIVLKKIKEEMQNRAKLIQEQIVNTIDNYDIEDIDRIFITSEYGDIPGINIFLEKILGKKSLGFEFYKEYNLDRLPVDPFLFLAMLETYYAYHENDFRFNYSLFLRRPTFFYRPSGILITSSILAILLLSIYPTYLYVRGEIYSYKADKINKKLHKLLNKKISLIASINRAEKKLKEIKNKINKYNAKIKKSQNIIETLYKFKYGYIPKSKDMVDITILMNKNKIYLQSLEYQNDVYQLEVYSYNDKNLAKFIKALVNDGFNVNFDSVQKEGNRYYTNIRIKE